MGRIKKISVTHPVSKVVIYNDGTCDAAITYNRSGYKIYFGKKGRKQGYYSLHGHVAQLFVPNPQNKPIVNHKDGKKYNARASNLEWVTHSENSRHAHRNGLWSKKLTKSDVKSIRKSTLSAERICYKYDVTSRHIYNIRSGRSWKHIF